MDRVVVWTEGTISYCGRLRASGNLRQQTFEEFWNSLPVQRARSLFLQDGEIESGCPATCCWLTARHPETYVKYFDGGPARRDLVPQLRPAQPRPHAARSYDENQQRIAQDIVTITTNGQHLSKTWAEFLMRFPFINIMAFSIDSFDPDVYARALSNAFAGASAIFRRPKPQGTCASPRFI